MTLARCLAALILWLVQSWPAVAQSTHSHATDQAVAEREITETLHAMYEAEKRKDLAFVKAHLSPEFFEVSGNGGIYRVTDIEAAWQDVTLRSYQLTDCVFRLLAPSVGLMSCKMDVDAAFKGQPIPSRMRVTYVWQKTAGNWLTSFEQATSMAASPIK